MKFTDSQVDPSSFPDDLIELDMGQYTIYNPFYDRQVHHYSSAVPLRDIKEGEELLDNDVGKIGT